MWSPTATEDVHQRVEASLKRGITSYYLLGQLLAMPVLLDRPETAVAIAANTPGPLSGQPGFDPWCLTDPASRSSWQRDPAARRAIEALWANDPDPAATLGIQAQIDAALAAGALLPARQHGRRLGSYYCCPWATIYLVRQPVTIAGRALRPHQQFVLDVSAEEVFSGGRFRRELVVLGPFHPTPEVNVLGPAPVVVERPGW